jgi:hypothetical protein
VPYKEIRPLEQDNRVQEEQREQQEQEKLEDQEEQKKQVKHDTEKHSQAGPELQNGDNNTSQKEAITEHKDNDGNGIPHSTFHDYEDVEDTLDLANRLKKFLPKFIPESDQPPMMERTSLFHDDLNTRNILVDDQGNIIAVLDWESTACVPAWKACDVPNWLHERSYRRSTRPDPKEFDGQENDPLYKVNLLEYQQARLRPIFLEHMKSKSPKWFEVYQASSWLRDFREAISCCNSSFCTKKVVQWLNHLEDNEASGAYTPLN